MEFVSSGISGLGTLKDVLFDTIGSIKDVGDISEVLQSLGIPPEIADIYQTFGETVLTVFESGKSTITSFVDEVIVPLMPVAQEFIGVAMEFIGNAVNGTMNVIDTLKSIITGLIENVIIPLMPVASSIIETAFDIISPILEIAGSLFEAISGAANFMVTEVIVPLLPLAAGALEGAWVIMKPILDAIASAFEDISDAVDWVITKMSEVGKSMKNFDVGDKVGGAVSWVTDKIPGLSVGLGRVPYDDMPAYLHKDEAVLPKDEADALRSSGILKGDGTDPTLDFGGGSYNSAAPISSRTSTSTVQAPVNIIVQGGNTDDETVFNIKEAMEDFFADLMRTNPQPREG